MEVVVFDFEGLFEEGKRGTEFFGAPENARKVVVSDSAVSVTLVCVCFGLL